MPATSNVTQAAAQSQGPQAADIANQFVHQYYGVLGKRPDKLHMFYNEDSVFSLCTVGDPKDPGGKNVVGREDIRQALAALDYGSCKVAVNPPHCQTSVGESVLIVVTGIIIPKDNSHRNFTQTFLLAKGKTWYVRNEFLHHLVAEEVVEEEDTEEPKAAATTAATTAAPASEPEPEAEAVTAPVAETAKPEPVAEEAKPAAAAAAPAPVAEVEVEAAVEDAAAAPAPEAKAKVAAAKSKGVAAKSKGAAKSAPAAGAGTAAPAAAPAAGGTTAPAAAPTANGGYVGRGRGGRGGSRRGRGGAAEAKGRGRGDKGKGWNNRQSNKGGKSQAAVAKPPANTWASRVGATPTAPVVAAAPVEADAADTAVTETDAATDATNATVANTGAAAVASGGPAGAGHKLATALFVSGLPQDPQVDEITDLFAQYGEVNNVQIHHAQNYCFVQFPTADAVESAMAVQASQPGTLLLRDATLMVDRKRMRTGHNRGRGGRNNRGGRGRRRGNDRKAGGDSRGRGRGIGGDRSKRGRGNAY